MINGEWSVNAKGGHGPPATNYFSLIRRHEQRIILVHRRLVDAIVVVGVDVIAIHTTQGRELICDVAVAVKNVLTFLLVISAVAFVGDA